MKKKLFLLLTVFLFSSSVIFAHDFWQRQQHQEKVINGAYRRHRVTPNEYQKLLREQDAIKYAIRKYEADGVWTDHEIGVVRGKLDRAEKRLVRYKTNGEY